MRKRGLLLVAGGVALLLLAGYVGLWLTAPAINCKGIYESEAIQYGQTADEVMTIMRVPPRDYRSVADLWQPSPEPSRYPDGSFNWWWHDDTGSLCVSFDLNDRVSGP